ncbi:enoyl-CoA hydratase-related protein [Phycisphaeraceae bacterium D3-23]
MSDKLVTWRRAEDGAAEVVFDAPGRPVNVLRAEVFAQVDAALDAIESLADSVSQIRFVSGKPGTFIAGADLKVIRDASDEELDAVLKQGQVLLDRVAGLSVQTFALVNGAALGGGLEVALACDARVVAAGEKPIIGLPEIGLGLVPGWGGTVRLVERLGVHTALPMLLAGKVVTPSEAMELGLADAVVPEPVLAQAGASVVPASPVESDGWAAVLEHARGGLSSLDPLQQPAGSAMLDTVEAGLRDGRQAGLDMERRSLVALRNTDEGRELIGRFFNRKKKA